MSINGRLVSLLEDFQYSMIGSTSSNIVRDIFVYDSTDEDTKYRLFINNRIVNISLNSKGDEKERHEVLVFFLDVCEKLKHLWHTRKGSMVVDPSHKVTSINMFRNGYVNESPFKFIFKLNPPKPNEVNNEKQAN
jgi:hypothetical protein